MTAPILNIPATTPAETMHPGASSLAASLPLRDIHLPEPVSWWPLAPGWWILLGSLIFIIALFFIVKKIRYSRRIKRASLNEFETIKNQYRQDNNAHQLIKRLSIFLRRACISFYPRDNTASLTGESWLTFLDSTMPGTDKKSSQTARFNSANGKVLITAPYLPENGTDIDIDVTALLDLCERWLKAQPVKNQFKEYLAEENTASETSSSAHHSLTASELKQ